MRFEIFVKRRSASLIRAVLFKRSGHLAPAIATHMAYNVIVLAF
jgi:membrane protease YdiL (CAAX protease family)